MKLYRTSNSSIVEHDDKFYSLPDFWYENSWDDLIAHDDLELQLKNMIAASTPLAANPFSSPPALRAPIGNQEVWAAGVTYFRSRTARMEESKSAGGGDFYDRVYAADRPELFFKATASRVVGPNGNVAIRKDASWSVPEPELTLLISARGKILGYTIGNDMSSRDIEGENPLYLPQAKVYNRSCALGPCILVSSEPMPSSTAIRLEIIRAGKEAFSGTTTLANLKRELQSLVEYLYRDNIFPNGCFLLTGTGIVPPDAFTLNLGDEIRISIDGIGTLVNFVG